MFSVAIADDDGEGYASDDDDNDDDVVVAVAVYFLGCRVKKRCLEILEASFSHSYI